METVLEIVEEDKTHLVNTREIEEGVVEEEETQLVNTREIDEGIDALKSMLRTVPPLRNECCIYRVPYELRRVNEEAYTPIVVSIGPFHHAKERLQEMEVQKQRYLNDFLERRSDLDLEYYFRSLKKFEERARNCYAENINFSSNDFIRMMLLDGCFIVEFLIKYYVVGLRNKDDPIFNCVVIMNGIVRDIVLLENQLPFFILEHLFNVIFEFGFPWEKSLEIYSFLEIVINTMDYFICNRLKWKKLSETYQAKHMVDLCLQYYTPTATGTKLPPETKEGIFRIPNASRLHESGVKFTKPNGSSVKCLLDVKFTSGNFEIPPIGFNDYTETFLRNLIAYEQVDDCNTQFFSEYTLLMDCLIDTPKDVELLRKAGIIDSLLGHDEEVSQSINKLGSGVVNVSYLYHQLCGDVNDYCKRRRHAWRAKLMRDYFNTPWRCISVAAAVFLLLLAIIQSVFSILQFVLE